MRPTQAKPITTERPNIIEDDDGNSTTDFQRNVHIYPSGPYIILLDFPVPPTRVSPTQPPKVDMGGPSYKLRSSYNKNTVPNFALAAKLTQVRESNAVTHQISGVAQEYRHLVKSLDRNFWEQSFENELVKLAKGIRTVKLTNTAIFGIHKKSQCSNRIRHHSKMCIQ